MNKSYKFVTDRIEVRSIQKGGRTPKYNVRGYGAIANKKHIYQYETGKDGKTKALKSMFTPHCVSSMKRQAKSKSIFVDSLHELGVNANIKSLLKNKLDSTDMSRINTWLKTKTLPFSKVEDLNIDDKGLYLDTYLNPAFRDVDEDHRNYFDAIWSSLENHYINGMSVNMIPTDVVKDDDGDLVINDVNLLGFSYVDNQAEEDCSIVEVAMRAAQEFKDEGENMEEAKKNEDMKKELDSKTEELKKAQEELANVKKKQEEEAKKTEEEKVKSEKEDIEKQRREMEETNKKLEAEIEKLKKENNNKDNQEADSGQSTVKPQDKFAGNAGEGKPKYDEKFYKDQIAEITADHDATIKAGKGYLVDSAMKGFGQLSVLVRETKGVDTSTLGLSETNARIVKEEGLMRRDEGDLVTSKVKH
jgi:flagellar biosynthesis GTPase FlhF